MTDERDLQKRLDELEARVTSLQKHVERLEAERRSPEAQSSGSEQAAPSLRDRAASFLTEEADGTAPDLAVSTEDWLNWIGVGLLLFGVIFLFRYSIEAGWLTPPVRVVVGAVFGLALIGVGLEVRPRRLRLGQVILGASSATLYTTVFAAYQLYGFVAYPMAFACMVAVTFIAFFLSVRQDDPALAVVGVLGGLGTPFLLYTEAGTIAGLVGYTCLILAGTAAIYFYQGWRALLYTSVIGGWLTFAFAYVNLPEAPNVEARVVLQLGVLFAWLLFWAVPVVRAVLHARHPEQWGASRRAPKKRSLIGAFLFRPAAHTLAFSSPLIALAFSRNMWELSGITWGALTLAASVLYGAVYLYMRRPALETLAQAHGLVAAVLLAYGLSELVGGDTLLLALAAEAAALHLLAYHLGDPALRLVGHFLFGAVALSFLDRGVFDERQARLFSPEHATELITLLLGTAASLGPMTTKTRHTYRLIAHLLFLGWLWHVLVPLANGQAVVTATWGAYAAILLVIGVRRRSVWLRNTALATLFLIVAKLFLVDLAELEALWRVLLFLGMGSAFLFISYYLPRLLGSEGQRISNR